MNQFIVFFITMSLVSSSSFAEQNFIPPKKTGMSHVTVTKEAQKEITPHSLIKEALDIVKTPAAQKEENTSPKQQIFKLSSFDDLKLWPHLEDIKSLLSKKRESAALRAKEDLSKVPPEALFYLARHEAQNKNMAEAATYLYLAQLRAQFDFKRFPPEKSGVRDAQLRLTFLAQDVGKRITPWVISDLSRAQAIYKDVEKLDNQTAYSYLPPYDITKIRPSEEDWPNLLEETRISYFNQARKYIEALNKTR